MVKNSGSRVDGSHSNITKRIESTIMNTLLFMLTAFFGDGYPELCVLAEV